MANSYLGYIIEAATKSRKSDASLIIGGTNDVIGNDLPFIHKSLGKGLFLCLRTILS